MEPSANVQPPSQTPSKREQELERRLTTIEARLATLEERIPEEMATTPPTAPTGTKQVDDAADTYWALTELSSRNNTADNTGAVMFAGHITTSEQEAMYQWTRPTDFFLATSWDDPMTRLTALAHPVRGTILRTLLDAPATAAQLAEKKCGHLHRNGVPPPQRPHVRWLDQQKTYRGIQYSHQQDRPLAYHLACCEDH